MQVVRTLLRLDGRGSVFWAFESISDVRELKGRDGGKQFRAIMAPPVRSHQQSLSSMPNHNSVLSLVTLMR